MHETRVHVKRHPLRGNHCHKDARFIMEVRGKKSGGTVYLYVSVIFCLLNTLHKSRSYLESMESSLRQNFLGFKVTIQLPRTILVCYRVQNIVRTRICIEKKKKKDNKDSRWKKNGRVEKMTKHGQSLEKFSSFPWLEKVRGTVRFYPVLNETRTPDTNIFSENGNNYRALVIVFWMNCIASFYVVSSRIKYIVAVEESLESFQDRNRTRRDLDSRLTRRIHR